MSKYEKINCHHCDMTFSQEARFIVHLTDIHDITDHLQAYLDLYHEGIHPTCACKPECDVLMPWAGWKKGFTSKYARGHNARVDSIYLDKDRQKEMAKKRAEGFKSGRLKTWNDGLTKETDERIKIASEKTSETLRDMYDNNGYKSWQTGLTKETDERVKNSSEARKLALDLGEIHVWNKGLTKHTNSSLASAAKKISARKQEYDPRRLTPDEFVRRVNEVTNFKLLSDPQEYRNKYQKLEFKCKECGSIQKKNLMMLINTPVCFKCHPKDSKAQLEIFEFVRSLAPDAILSDRTVISPKELDIYAPSRRFAIEYNGLYYHSEKFLPDDYHKNKHQACVDVGIKLLSIYEDEWRDKRVLVEGMIKHRLGLDNVVANARSLSVKQIDQDQARVFFEANHLEGHARCRVAYGLFDGETCVAAMSMRTPFHKKHVGASEVARCAVKCDHNVRGWLGKLTKAATTWAQDQGYNRMMTYVDQRVGQGDSYVSAGWNIVSMSKQRFWWTDFDQRYNRFKYKADKTKGMTQQQIADEAGVVKVFGCGNTLLNITLT